MLTEEQLEEHNKNITGSKIASILNLPGAFKSKFQVFCEMHGDIEIENESNIRAKMGNYAELSIDAYCKNELGWLTWEKKETKYHPSFCFICSHVDRLMANKKGEFVLEYKNVDSLRKREWLDDDNVIRIPEYYLTQIYLYMNIYNLSAKMVVVFGGNDPHVIDVPRNLQIENFLIDVCVKFWEDLKNDKYPQADDSNACTETLKKLYPNNNDILINGIGVIGQENIVEHAFLYKRASQKMNQAEQEKNLHGNFLKNIIKGNEGIIWPDGSKVTYKKCEDSEKFNEKKFKEENPQLHKKYCDPKKGYRILRVDEKFNEKIN